MNRILSAAAPLLLLSGIAVANPPRINTVFPPAVQRGVESRLESVGTGLGGAMDLVAPLTVEVKRTGASGGPAKSAALPSFVSDGAALIVKPAADTLPGVYPVRVRTPAGVSNLRLIEVTDLPVVTTREPNGRYKNGK